MLGTLQGTNIFPYQRFWVDDFPNFPMWDMLIPWRVNIPYSFPWDPLSEVVDSRLPHEALAKDGADVPRTCRNAALLMLLQVGDGDGWYI